MTYSHVRVDLHNNGDCDAATCPLCALEDEFACAGCGNETDDPADCDHTELHCRDCADEGYCHLCVRERGEDA